MFGLLFWSFSRLARGIFRENSILGLGLGSILGSIRPQYSCQNYLGSSRKPEMKDDSLPTCRTFPVPCVYAVFHFPYFFVSAPQQDTNYMDINGSFRSPYTSRFLSLVAFLNVLAKQ